MDFKFALLLLIPSQLPGSMTTNNKNAATAAARARAAAAAAAEEYVSCPSLSLFLHLFLSVLRFLFLAVPHVLSFRVVGGGGPPPIPPPSCHYLLLPSLCYT